MAVVPATNMWVDANFKETQIANMRIGQPVTITTDIYGDDVKYTGKVVGLDMGTGSAFSLLPAQNATVTGSKSFSVCLCVLNWTRNSWSNTRCVSVYPRW